MNKHRKAILILAAAQIVCLACGLWVRDRFLVATVEWQAKNEAANLIPGTSDRPVATTNPDGSTLEGSIADTSTIGDSLPAADSVPTFTQVQAAMPMVLIMTLVWIGGLQSIVAYLVLSRLLSESSKNQEESQIRLLSREKDLIRTRNAVIFGLAKLAEYRDKETGQHLERIALLATCLATALRRDPRFRDSVSPTFVKTIGISSVLHDIGKVGLPDSILCKEGPLTDHQRDRMQSHTAIGAECIRQIEQRLGNCNFLQMARQIAMHHHERWDGTGYPNGLAGADIPLAARVVAIVDVYDALVSKRCYKDAMPHQQCVEMIVAASGTHLDPALIEVFRRVEPQFWAIASRYADPHPAKKEPSQIASQKNDSHQNDRLIASILDQGEAAGSFAATH